MDNHHDPRKLRLYFEGADGHRDTLTARVLAKSLQQIQKIIYLLAKFHQCDELGQGRVHISHYLRKRFVLVCKAPEEGSYVLPVEIGNLSSQESLQDDDVVHVGRTFHHVTQSVSQDDLSSLRKLVPDAAYRTSLLKAYKDVRPSKRSGLILSIEDSGCQKIFDGAPAKRYLSGYNAGTDDAINGRISSYVTGTLVSIHFKKQNLQLTLPNGRVLHATYNDDVESALLDHPHDLIQVHGNVLYDERGRPVSVVGIDEVLEIDESPVEICELTIDNVHYKIDPPLHFDVGFDREDQLYDLQGDFDVTLSDESRSELTAALDLTLKMLWAEYALEDPQRLSPQGRKLRDEIRRRFRDMRDGA